MAGFDLNFLATIVSLLLGCAMGVAVIVVFIKSGKLQTGGIVMLAAAVILIGAPTFWNTITISYKDLSVVFDRVETISTMNAELRAQQKQIEADKQDLNKRIEMLRKQIESVPKSATLSREIKDSFSGIDRKTGEIQAASDAVTQKLDASGDMLADLQKRKAELLPKTSASR